MRESGVRTTSGPSIQSGALDRPDEAVLLVAALTAALVEHRHCSNQADTFSETETGRANWRMVTRLEQLRGRT
jgi:hypothetical protein